MVTWNLSNIFSHNFFFFFVYALVKWTWTLYQRNSTKMNLEKKRNKETKNKQKCTMRTVNWQIRKYAHKRTQTHIHAKKSAPASVIWCCCCFTCSKNNRKPQTINNNRQRFFVLFKREKTMWTNRTNCYICKMWW